MAQVNDISSPSTDQRDQVCVHFVTCVMGNYFFLLFHSIGMTVVIWDDLL